VRKGLIVAVAVLVFVPLAQTQSKPEFGTQRPAVSLARMSGLSPSRPEIGRPSPLRF